jgi:hypothetical protein
MNGIHAVFVHVNPRKVCISEEAGYHGTKGLAQIIRRLNNLVNANKSFLMIGNTSAGTSFGVVRR